MSGLLHAVWVVGHGARARESLTVDRALAGRATTHIRHLLLAVGAHHIRELGSFELAEVEVDHVATGSCINARMFNARGDFVVNDGLLVFADNVDSEFQHVLLA